MKKDTRWGRPRGRLFSCLISVILMAGALHGQTPAKTTISDTLYRADGTPASGTLLISWPAFTTADSKPVAAGSTRVTVGTGGAISVDLVPNTGATPAGTYYKVVMQLADGSSNVEYWVVPSSSPTTISAIRTNLAVLPKVGGSGDYVRRSGDTMTGALSINAPLTATGITSTAATGLAPFTVNSTTLVNNLNADLLDGKQASDFVSSDNTTFTGTTTIASADINGGTIDSTVIGGSTPAAGTFTTLSATGGIEDTPIGQTTPAAGTFTTLNSTGGALNGTIGATTPANGTFTTVLADDIYTRSLNALRYADQFPGADYCARVAAAIADLPSTGGTVDARGLEGTQSCASDPFSSLTKDVQLLLGHSTITTDTAWTLADNLKIQGAGIGVSSAGGSVLKTTGAIWAFRNPNQATATVISPTLRDFTIDLSGNTSATGAIDLSTVSYDKLDNVSIILPGGDTGIIGIKVADPSCSGTCQGGYWHDHYGVKMYATTPNNNHIGYYFGPSGNDTHVFGGAIERVGRPVVCAGSSSYAANNNSFYGVTMEGSQDAMVEFTGYCDNNSFYSNRIENAGKTITTLARSGNVVTATFSGGHNHLYSNGGKVAVVGSTGGSTAFDGTFTIASVPDANTLTWSQTGPDESPSTNGTALFGMGYKLSANDKRNNIMWPTIGSLAAIDSDSSASTNKMLIDHTNGIRVQFPGVNNRASLAVGTTLSSSANGTVLRAPASTAHALTLQADTNSVRGLRFETTGGTQWGSIINYNSNNDLSLSADTASANLVLRPGSGGKIQFRSNAGSTVGTVDESGNAKFTSLALGSGSNVVNLTPSLTATRTLTVPDANSTTVIAQTCTGTDKVSAISSSGTVTCSADETSAGGGDSVSINGSAATDPNFNDTTPAAQANHVNVKWQVSGGSVSAEVPTGTSSSTVAAGDHTHSGYAPSDATYITRTASAGLSAEQALGDLATGMLKNTTTTGVLSIAVAGTDYVAPNSVITGSTQTKITYDSKGLVTAGAQAAASDLSNGTTGSGNIVLASSPTIATPSFTTGFTIGGAAASGKVLRGNGSNYVADDDVRNVCYLAGGDNASSALADTDDQPGFWINELGRTYRVVRVWAQSDAGTPSINVARDDGTAANILSSNLSSTTGNGTCADSSGGSMTVRGGSITCSNTISSAERDIAQGDAVNFVMGTAGGTAKRVTVCLKLVAQ